MSTLAAPAAPSRARPHRGAAELAARIQIPRRLPVRYDGQPLRHLSHSSYTQVPAVPRRLAPPLPARRAHPAERRTCSSAPASTTPSPPTTATCSTCGERAHARPAPGRLPRPLDARARRRTGQARRALGRTSSTSRARSPWACRRSRSRLRELVPAARPAGRRPARARVRARARPGMDDPGLPRPRDAAPERRRRRARPGDRRLQGQEHAALPGQGRPRPAGRPLPRRALARRRARRAVLLRPDRQARQETQDHEHRVRRHPPHGPASCARRSCGSRRPPARSHALYERFGPDEPWGFADPSGWKCSPRYCGHHARCPGGGGL